MLENSLAYLGNHLSKRFGLDKNRIVYADREFVFNRLSDQTLPVDLPAIAYSNTDISSEHMNTKPYAGLANVNLSTTLGKRFEFIPIKVDISFMLMCNNITEHFKYVKDYFLLAKQSQFSTMVTFNDVDGVNIEQQVDTNITNISPLTSPPEGREGRDFDRGLYYVLEGNFLINSLLIYFKDQPIIRQLEYDLIVDRPDWSTLVRLT